MNRRKQMIASNQQAIKWLLHRGFDQIWLKTHTQFQDRVYCQDKNYYANDIWNLFDGIAFGQSGIQPIFLQIHTDSWDKWKKTMKFSKEHGITAIMINVTKPKGRYVIHSRAISTGTEIAV